jgi:LDH2 family malate/lactate/ureidoglycolate dehydrogenase
MSTALKTTITFSAPVAVGVTRVATIVLTHADGSVDPSFTLDVTDPTATFASVDGDSASATAIDTNATGPSVASAPFVGVLVAPVVGTVPDAPVITGFSSTLA